MLEFETTVDSCLSTIWNGKAIAVGRQDGPPNLVCTLLINSADVMKFHVGHFSELVNADLDRNS